LEGVFKPLRSKAGAFSKANWGDYITHTPRGPKTLKRASVFLKEINKLVDQQWDDIIAAAWDTDEVSKHRLALGLGEAGVIDDAEESSSDDSELLDPLYA
jgi:hypothetical protein